MQFTQETILERPREVVWRAFDNPVNLPRWQPGLVGMEHTSGTPGEPGSVTVLRFHEHGRDIELVESIRARRVPEEFTASYNSRHASNVVSNRFEDLDGQRTRWIFHAEFHFHGSLKLLAPLIKGTIRKRLVTDSARFKAKLEADELEVG